MKVKHLTKSGSVRSKGNHLGSLATASSYGTGVADNIRLTKANIKTANPNSILREINLRKSRPQKYITLVG